MANLTNEELVPLVGELAPGESGFLPLDANGTPSGPATKVQTAESSVVVKAGYTDQGEAPLITPSGAPITDQMEPFHSVVYEFDDSVAPPISAVLESILPNTAELNSPDVTLHCIGTGFTPSSVIYFAGQPEPIVFVSAEEVTTVVKPSLPWGAVTVNVSVDDSEALPFTFTEPAARTAPPPRGSKTS